MTLRNRKAYDHEYYVRRREVQLKRVSDHRKSIRQWFSEYKKNLSCAMCGEADPRVLEFHHRRHEDKKFAISSMVNKGNYPIASIMREMEKCTVICANCHRKFHYKDQITRHETAS